MEASEQRGIHSLWSAPPVLYSQGPPAELQSFPAGPVSFQGKPMLGGKYHLSQPDTQFGFSKNLQLNPGARRQSYEVACEKVVPSPCYYISVLADFKNSEHTLPYW